MKQLLYSEQKNWERKIPWEARTISPLTNFAPPSSFYKRFMHLLFPALRWENPIVGLIGFRNDFASINFYAIISQQGQICDEMGFQG